MRSVRLTIYRVTPKILVPVRSMIFYTRIEPAVIGQPHRSRFVHFVSLVEKNYGPRIAPDRVSSGPTRFTGSVAMDFMSGHAPIDPIEAKREHFDV